MVHPPDHLDPKSDNIATVSPTSPTADEADRQRIVLYLQEQNEQLLRQLNDAVAAMKKVEADWDALEKNVEDLLHSGDEFHGPLEPQRPTGSLGAEAGPSSTQEGPSASKWTACPSTHDAGPSTSSNVLGEEPRSSSTQFDSESHQDEARTRKGKEREINPSHPTDPATGPQSAVHALNHHDLKMDDVVMTSSVSPATDAVDVQCAILRLQEQVEQLRRQFDDSKAESYLLEMEVNELRSQASKSHKQQGPRLSTGLPTAGASSSSQAQSSGSKSTAVEFTLG
ncbi:hypothetical protein BDN67DRAFT_733441 [Paxillus ammoniavirescens]|nr:hypothetical protein BDN67DRAFT_733441 [Paxillus ammoniavirescens]